MFALGGKGSKQKIAADKMELQYNRNSLKLLRQEIKLFYSASKSETQVEKTASRRNCRTDTPYSINFPLESVQNPIKKEGEARNMMRLKDLM